MLCHVPAWLSVRDEYQLKDIMHGFGYPTTLPGPNLCKQLGMPRDSARPKAPVGSLKNYLPPFSDGKKIYLHIL